MTGYFGLNCDIPCRFPSYGESCQSECGCEKQQCNHITGCESIVINQIPSSTFIKNYFSMINDKMLVLYTFSSSSKILRFFLLNQ